MKCVNCYREINDNLKFCVFCGAKQPTDRAAYEFENPDNYGAMSNEDILEQERQRELEEANFRAQEEANLRAQEEANRRAQEEANLRAQEEANRRAQEEAQSNAQNDVDHIFCNYCGRRASKLFSFCPFCGQPLDVADPRQPQQPISQPGERISQPTPPPLVVPAEVGVPEMPSWPPVDSNVAHVNMAKPKKKKSTGLIVGIILGVLIILGSLGFAIYSYLDKETNTEDINNVEEKKSFSIDDFNDSDSLNNSIPNNGGNDGKRQLEPGGGKRQLGPENHNENRDKSKAHIIDNDESNNQNEAQSESMKIPQPRRRAEMATEKDAYQSQDE